MGTPKSSVQYKMQNDLATNTTKENVFFEYIASIRWGPIMFCAWFWFRCNIQIQEWAFQEITNRWGNPAVVIDINVQPTEAGDNTFFLNYRHVITEFRAQMFAPFSDQQENFGSVLMLYIILVEFMIILRTFCFVELIRSNFILTLYLYKLSGIFASRKTNVSMMVSNIKQGIIIVVDVVCSVHRFLRPGNLLPETGWHLFVGQFSLITRFIVELPCTDWFITTAVYEVGSIWSGHNSTGHTAEMTAVQPS